MEKVRPWCGEPSDRGRLKNRNGVTTFARSRLKKTTSDHCWVIILKLVLNRFLKYENAYFNNLSYDKTEDRETFKS